MAQAVHLDFLGRCFLDNWQCQRGWHLYECSGCSCLALVAQVVYSEFLDLVNTGNVQQARIDESLQKVYFSVRPLQPAELQDAAAQASTSGHKSIHSMVCAGHHCKRIGFEWIL